MYSKPVCRVRDPKWINRVPPSAERKGHVPSSGFERPESSDTVETHSDFPSLPDLLDELEADVDFNSLEQLTQSLLQDIARDLEATAQKTEREISTINGIGSTEMPEQTTTELETCRSDRDLKFDLSEYLLLYHNYAAPPKTKQSKTPTRIRKLKSIKPRNIVIIPAETETVLPPPQPNETEMIKLGTLEEVSNVIAPVEIETVLPTPPNETEIVKLGTLEEVSNVTIIVDSDGRPITTESLLTEGSLNIQSPTSFSNDSDAGYESIDSPPTVYNEDLWDQSISELFPTLFTV